MMAKKENYETPVVEMHQVFLEQAIAGSVEPGKHEGFNMPNMGEHEGMVDNGDQYFGG